VAVAQPWVDVVLSGASTPAMLESNLSAMTVHAGADVQERLHDLAEPTEEYWSARSQLAWT
jgi:aryl-alcohol dehydrogenase-like predicted oxidoreductase